MKVNSLIRTSPFFATLLLILCLSIRNQKEYTKLRILIWDTPSLSLGTYIAISTTSGFILSYLFTTNISRVNKAAPYEKLKFKDESEDEINNEHKYNKNMSYDNTLIERDINDPSPTINANFRVIGRKDRTKESFISTNNNIQYDGSYEFEEQYDEPTREDETINQVNSISSDWNDESYFYW